VITPSFNQGRFLSENLESVRAQGYPNYEHIVIDGGSSDESVEILERYAHAALSWVSEPDRGQAHALNKGFARASGEILCWLNADDAFRPNALERVATAFMSADCDMVAGICELTDGDRILHRHLTSCGNGPLPLDAMLDLDNGWNAGQFFYQPEVFFTRDLFDRAGGEVREDLFFSMDYELWTRFARHDARLQVIGAPLVRFRVHADQKTADIHGFKRELEEVRAEIEPKAGPEPTRSRPPYASGQTLRIVMLNDLGPDFGAGIAHGRIAAALELAGHEIHWFRLLDSNIPHRDYDDIARRVERLAPDLIVVGNLHAVERENISLLARLAEEYPVFWVCHDFWAITGRCAYMQDCGKYLQGCDAACPTASEYPVLARECIADAWSAKTNFLRNAGNLTLLANSEWTARTLEQALTHTGSSVPVLRVRLGAPAHVFKPRDRQLSRERFAIADEEFVIGFSSSSLSDWRKGAHHLLAALGEGVPDGAVLLAMGRVDRKLEIAGTRLIEVGYLPNDEAVAEALNACDVYVGPSTEETFGQVFIEAALCGTPSIGFDCTGVRDAVVHGVTGLRVPEGDASALSAAIRRIAEDDDFSQQLRHGAAAYAAAHFSLEQTYHSLFQAMDQRGLVDRMRLPHKISFRDREQTRDFRRQGTTAATLRAKVNRAAAGSARRAIEMLPSGLTGPVRQSLPMGLQFRLMRWLSGR